MSLYRSETWRYNATIVSYDIFKSADCNNDIRFAIGGAIAGNWSYGAVFLDGTGFSRMRENVCAETVALLYGILQAPKSLPV